MKLPFSVKKVRNVLFLFSVGVSLLFTQQASAQVPTISSFLPVSAAPGTDIIISGTNFNSTTTNNIVYIGGIKASVTVASSTSLTVTVPKGALYGHITVTNSANSLTAYSKDYFLPTITTPKAILTSIDLPYQGDLGNLVGKRFYGMVTGDLNGDGKPDLVTADNGPATPLDNALQVFLNTTATVGGNVSLGTPANFTFTGYNSQGMPALADIDGDGNLDIIATTSLRNLGTGVASNGSMIVLRNQGAGTFTASSEFTTGLGPNAAYAVDIDGDGLPDVATMGTSPGIVSVLRNTSSGPGNINFEPKVDYSTIGNPVTVYLVDLDGDGKPDMVLPRTTSSGFDVRLNTSIPGTISFSAAQFIAGSNFPGAIAAGDIDGDGKTDLVFAFAGSVTDVSIYRNTSSGAGNISFASSTVNVGTGQQAVTLGDLNGDGKPDLVVGPEGTAGEVMVFRNTSAVNAVSFDVDGRIRLTQPVNYSRGLAVADFNNDGVNDMVAGVTNNGLFSVYRGSMQFPPTITSLSSVNAAPGTSITITGTNFNSTAANNTVYFGAIKATVTGGSTTSLTVTVPVNASYGPLTVLNTGNTLSVQSIQHFTPAFSPGKAGLSATDFTAQTKITSTGSSIYGMVTVDLNNDGKPDLVETDRSGNQVFFRINNSTTATVSFAAPVTKSFSSYAEPAYPAAADIDGDGKQDILVPSFQAGKLAIMLNTGNTSTTAITTDLTTGTNPLMAAAADLDGDGKPDIVTANYPGSISIFRNLNSIAGTVSFSTKTDLATGVDPIFVVLIEDIDGDGKKDIITQSTDVNNPTNHISVFRNTSTVGSISFDTRKDFTTLSGVWGMAVRDLDNDGKPEIVVTYSKSGIASFSVFKNISTSANPDFATRLDFNTAVRPQKWVAINDLNGDGKPDLVLSVSDPITPSNYVVSLFPNTSNGGTISFGTKADLAAEATPQVNLVQDFDGDGRPDVLSGNYDNHTVNVYRNTLVAPPGTQASSIVANLTGTTAALSWTNGSGAKRAVFIKADNTGTPAPDAGTDYTANTAFGSGSQISASGWYTVYNGTGTSVTVNGLTASTTYRAMVVEYNDGGLTGTAQYNVTTPTDNPLNFTTPATLSSIVRAASTASINTATTTYTVTFGSTVTGLSTSNFTLTASSGITGSGVQSISGSGTTYTLTVNTGTGDGTLTLNLDNATGLTPGLTNTLPFTGETYTIDKTVPTLTAVTIASNNSNTAKAKAGDQVTISFTSSETIGTPTVTISGAAATITNTSGDNWTATYTLLSGNTAGTIAFNIAFSDPTGNAGTAVTATTNSSTVVFDETVPTLSTVTIASNNTDATRAKEGDIITLSFTASEAILAPSVSIAGHTITATNGSGNAWTATYTMLSSDAAGAITFNIAFSDLASNAGTAVTATTNSSSVLFDKTLPTLNTVTIASSNTDATRAKVGDVITLSFTASEAILSPTVSIAGHTVTATNGSGNTWSATYTMASSDAEGASAFNIAFSDLASNAGTAVTTTTNSSSVLFDKTVPTLSTVTIASNNTDATRAKTGDVITLSFTASEAMLAPTVSIAGHTTTATNGSGNTWAATYTLVSGDATGTVAFNIAFSDLASNAGTAVTATTNSSSVLFDKTVPILSTVTIASNNTDATRAKTGDVITLSFTASEAMLAPTVSIAGHTTTATNGSGNTWAATYTLVSGDVAGTIAFNIAFSDLASNAGTAVAATTNNSNVLFDKTIPTLSSVAIASSNTDATRAKVGDVISLSFTASETILAPTVSIAGHTVTATNGSGNTWIGTYTTASSDAAGTIAFNIAFSDLAGNAGTTVTTTSNNSSVLFDKTSPTLTSVTIASDNTGYANAKAGTTISLSFTSSENISTPTVTIAGRSVIATGSGTNWQASTAMTVADAEGAIGFTINYADPFGNAGSIVTTTSDNKIILFDKTAPVINSVSIASNNANPALAVPGDVITLTVSANEVLVPFSVSLAQNNVNAVNTLGNTWKATHTVTSADLNGRVQLSFVAKDLANNTASPVQATTDLSAVTINTITYVNTAPTLALIQNQALCLDNASHTLMFTGITAGSEAGQNVTLTVSTDKPELFDQLTAGAIANGNSTLSYKMKAIGSATITVTVKDNGGTENGGVDTFSRTFTITSNTAPVATISSDLGTEISLGAVANLTASGGSTYSWSNAAGIVSGQNTPVLTVRPTVTTTYTVTVSNASGCSSTQSITLNVKEDYRKIEPSNILTPDGDGKNDKFVIKNIELYPNNVLRIFDRAGREVYSKRQYANDWEGTLNGVPLSEDAYFYVIDFGDGRGPFKGVISIIRNK